MKTPGLSRANWFPRWSERSTILARCRSDLSRPRGSPDPPLTVPEVIQALAAVERELLAELDRDRLMRLIADRAGELDRKSVV